MKKKRVLSLMLTGALAISMLAGCSSSGSSSSSSDTEETEEEEAAAEEETEETEEAEETVEEDSAETADEEEHEPVTLTIVHEHSEEAAESIVTSAAYRYCMELYKQDHPWVTLEETVISNSDIGDKYATLIAADELPDLTYVNPAWLETMVEGDMLVDLTDYVDTSKYYDGLAGMTYDGKIYGMANKYSVYNLICYNEALWAEAGYDEFPSTFEEMIEADAAFNEMGIDTISLGNTAQWFATTYFMDALAYDYCGEDWVNAILAGDDSVSFTDDEFVAAMTALAELSDLFNADFNMTDDVSAATMYMQGLSAAHVVGGWGVATLESLAEDYPEVWENTRVVMLPAANGADGTLINACGANMGVSSRLLEEGNEAKLEAAIEFCQYISSDYYASYCAEHGTTTPVIVEYDWSDLGQPYVDLANVINSAPSTGQNFNDYMNPTVVSTMNTEVQSVLAGATDPETACANIQATQETIFGE